jgi:hypothetical protein
MNNLASAAAIRVGYSDMPGSLWFRKDISRVVQPSTILRWVSLRISRLLALEIAK